MLIFLVYEKSNRNIDTTNKIEKAIEPLVSSITIRTAIKITKLSFAINAKF